STPIVASVGQGHLGGSPLNHGAVVGSSGAPSNVAGPFRSTSKSMRIAWRCGFSGWGFRDFAESLPGCVVIVSPLVLCIAGEQDGPGFARDDDDRRTAAHRGLVQELEVGDPAILNARRRIEDAGPTPGHLFPGHDPSDPGADEPQLSAEMLGSDRECLLSG